MAFPSGSWTTASVPQGWRVGALEFDTSCHQRVMRRRRAGGGAGRLSPYVTVPTASLHCTSAIRLSRPSPWRHALQPFRSAQGMVASLPTRGKAIAAYRLC